MPHVLDSELCQIFYLAVGNVGSLLETVINASEPYIKREDVGILNAPQPEEDAWNKR